MKDGRPAGDIRRLAFWLSLAGEAALLAAAARHGDFATEGAALRFVPLALGAGACFFAAMFFAKAEPLARGAWFFWAVAVALRVAMWGCEPSDDFHRYVWEGRAQLAGKNPYVLAPDAPELAALRDASWEKMSQREWRAIYPPLAQMVFAAAARMPEPAVVLRLLILAADLATAWLLVRLLDEKSFRAERSEVEEPRGATGCMAGAAWYAWNPAVIYAFAGAAHFDSLMLLAMSAALLAFARGTTWRLALAGSVALGAAIALKATPLFLLPACAVALRRRAPALLAAVAIPVALVFAYGGPGIVAEPVRAFADVARMNDLTLWIAEATRLDSLYWAPMKWLGVVHPWPMNRVLTALMLAVAITAAWRWRDDWPRAALWAMGGVLVLSPVLHPWYALWILPVAVWRGAWPWAVFAVSALAGLLLWETTALWQAWEGNFTTRALVAAPALAAFFFKIFRTKNRTAAFHR